MLCDLIEYGIVLLGLVGDCLTRWASGIASKSSRSPVPRVRRGQRDLYDPPAPPQLPDRDDEWDMV